MEYEITNKSKHEMPAYETEGSAGLDLRANITESIILNAGERILIKTGIYLEMSNDLEAQVRPRSGLSYKYGITVLNSPGTIDSDYKNEVGVILINHGGFPFMISDGDRIAQLVFSPVVRDERYIKNETRNGGFGSTNTK